MVDETRWLHEVMAMRITGGGVPSTSRVHVIWEGWVEGV